MTLAEAARARFEELERTNPADLSRHLKNTVRLAIKTTIVEERRATRAAPGMRVVTLEFPDASRLRIDQIKKFRETFRWTGCDVL